MRTLATLLWIALTPAAVASAAVLLPRVVRALRRRLTTEPPRPTGPPLEQVAADLRRLLADHERIACSPRLPARARRLDALEGAITDRAFDAALAVGLDPPARAGRGALQPESLRGLLFDLARSGVVLPGVERFGR